MSTLSLPMHIALDSELTPTAKLVYAYVYTFGPELHTSSLRKLPINQQVLTKMLNALRRGGWLNYTATRQGNYVFAFPEAK